jgi:hypothetical protein
VAWIEFGEIADRWRVREERENFRAGLAASVVLNLFLPRSKRVLPLDFFEGKKTVRQTPEEMLEKIVFFNLAMGGRDLRQKKEKE